MRRWQVLQNKKIVAEVTGIQAVYAVIALLGGTPCLHAVGPWLRYREVGGSVLIVPALTQ